VKREGGRLEAAAAESEAGEIEECVVRLGTDRKGGGWGSLAHAFNEREGGREGARGCVCGVLLITDYTMKCFIQVW
jgi:hypothetical protein